MPLPAGARVGPYEVTAAIGAGGMGEVYRARDTKLKRDVALKVLPDSFTTDPDRLARFQREAEVLAALNHSHIAHIHGLEESDGVRALVLEFVDGPTLADRIAEGPIPLDEALPIARQIADALEAAHEQGIIHRDLKPANIKLRPDGTVKVLDFGLAKALDQVSGVRGQVSGDHRGSPANSPTITSPAMTQMGVILGTAAYMSPEQAKGKSADKRSDIWAFGCVLFEMLAGKPAFHGDDVSDTLAAVLRAEPDWQLVPAMPAAIKRLLTRCLEKSARQRLQHIGDARLDLDEAEVVNAEPARLAARGHAAWQLFAAAVVGAMLAAAGAWLQTGNTSPAPVARFTIQAPHSVLSATGTPANDLALSPDGRTIVFVVRPTGLFRRRLDAASFEPIAGTEGGSAPFFSPDGAWIGFVAGGKLKKVPADGGLAITLGEAPDILSATWGDDGSIIAARRGGDLYEISSTGGTLQLFLEGGSAGGFRQPWFVPGSQAVLVRSGAAQTIGHIEMIERRSKARHRLVDGTDPKLTAGHDLVYQQQGQIWAARLDPRRFAVVGKAVPVVDSVRVLGATSTSLFTISANGSLAYIGGAAGATRSMVWIDRAGTVSIALNARGAFQSPRLSPDGKRVVVSAEDGGGLDLWSYDLERGARLRLTMGGRSRRTVWSPDGKQIAFYSAGPEGGIVDQDLHLIPSNGGEPTRLVRRPGPQFPDTWSPDGRFIVFSEGEGGMGASRNLWVLPLGQEPKPLLETEFHERGAVFSPDGEWLAFVTNESGLNEVYVQPFPGPGSKIPISTNGGVQPMWSRDGRELFYREADWLMSVRVTHDPFSVATPQKLFELPAAAYNFDNNFADYDVAPDGRFFAIRGDDQDRMEINVVLNWSEELRRLLAPN